MVGVSVGDHLLVTKSLPYLLNLILRRSQAPLVSEVGSTHLLEIEI